MRISEKTCTLLWAALAMLALILDMQTAMTGAAEGVELCIRTLIPALFPFFVLSSLLTSAFSGVRTPVFAPLGKFLGIPSGGESIFLIGILGGYPVGAQCVGQAFQSGQLKRKDAMHMLSFCSNAGPAFLFGVVGSVFGNQNIPFLLWIIHIVAALLVGYLSKTEKPESTVMLPDKTIDLSSAMTISLRNMASVCGWVILFRILIAFFQRWLFWLLPPSVHTIFCGLLELANGCLELDRISEEPMRFVMASMILGFGGVCVGMQTSSVLNRYGLSGSSYFRGKLLQGLLSGLLSWMVLPVIDSSVSLKGMMIMPICIFLFLILKFRKNNSSIPSKTGV